MELLVKSGANVNVTDKVNINMKNDMISLQQPQSSSTLLHVAVEYGHTQIADILLKHGIYVNSINKVSTLSH